MEKHVETLGCSASSLLKFHTYLHELVLPFLLNVNVLKSNPAKVLRRCFINTYVASV